MPLDRPRPLHRGALALVTSAAIAVSPIAAAPQYVGGEGYRWDGADGEELPFTDHSEARDFLSQAKVVEMENIPVGVTKPKKATLELDGVMSCPFAAILTGI